MCKVKIEQGYNTIELEVPFLPAAAFLVQEIKPFVAKETKFTIEETAEEKKGEEHESV